MIVANIDKSLKGLLFFAQLAEELLFYRSHDSFKVPTLNFHYLCMEASIIIHEIEQGILERGNIVPIVFEFEESFKNDPIATSFYGNDLNIIFDSKNDMGYYRNTYKEIQKDPTCDSSIRKLKDRIVYLIEDLSRGNRYYKEAMAQIKKLVCKTDLGFEELDLIKQYTRIVLTELVNIGYSEEYIYSVVKDLFFNNQTHIDDAEAAFDRFLTYFTLEKKTYAVYLPIYNSKLKEDLSSFLGLKIANNVYEMFGGTPSYILRFDVESYDPECAVTYVLDNIDFCTSVTQYTKHGKQTYTYKYAEVVDKNTKEVLCLKSKTPPIHRQHRIAGDVQKIARASLVSAVYDAISLHSSAFSSKDMKNQLLDLWTAMEVLFPIEKKGSYSKINQIANAASTVLSCDHIRNLLIILDSKLQTIIGAEYTSIIESNSILGKCPEEKLLAIILLDEYAEQYEFLQSRLINYPLCSFNMHQYKKMFSSGKGIEQFYNRHSKRLIWQIMRIYRSRNLIIHDGSTLPFLSVILQNLHFYIDTIVDAFCNKYDEGFESPIAIITEYTRRECQHLEMLKKDIKISGENFSSAVFG